jgi:aminomethyltransferase
MGSFAGWEMPIQYAGVMAEHLHTRAAASLFDVSHMGQAILRGSRAAAHLEALMPSDLLDLPEGRMRYGLLTDEAGGILDDLIATNRGDHLLLVVNASRREADLAHIRQVTEVEDMDRALLALQGPGAEAALLPLLPGADALGFMECATLIWRGHEVWASRSGYTGEDGFELSLPLEAAEGFARSLIAQPDVLPAGLGARDSLRLEAGLCLRGADIDTSTSPVEAALAWAIPTVRRMGGARAAGFPGADRILREIELGPSRLRVGLRPEGRAPIRGGVPILGPDGHAGHVTSGTFGPSVAGPIAMGYVAAPLAVPGTRLTGEVRGKELPIVVAPLPFIPHRTRRRGRA